MVRRVDQGFKAQNTSMITYVNPDVSLRSFRMNSRICRTFGRDNFSVSVVSAGGEGANGRRVSL